MAKGKKATILREAANYTHLYVVGFAIQPTARELEGVK
jgi:hypothetical protein